MCLETEGYDVLRLIEHGKLSYVSSDYVQGRPLMQWLKSQPNISKELLFVWMRQLVIQLGQFHKVRGEPNYKYVNPYSLIVSEEEKLYLLDLGADSNQGIIKQMQRRAIRECFLPEGENFYQKESKQLDIYGIGRTLQYLLSVTDPDPVITKREELKLKKIISKCQLGHSKKSFQTIQDIQKYFPLWNQKKSPKSGKKVKRIIIPLLCIGIISSTFLRENADESTKKPPEKKISKVDTAKQKEQGKEEDNSREVELEFKMGLLYLLETEEYEKSFLCFRKIQDEKEVAKSYLTIAQWMSGERLGNTQSLKKSLDYAKENVPKEHNQECRRVLIRGYMQMDTKEAAQNVVLIGNEFIQNGRKEEDLDEKIVLEIEAFMAAAYEELGELGNAVKLYEKQLKVELRSKEKEGLYKKITLLYEALEQKDQAGEYCLKGMEEFPDVMELRLLYIGLLCRNTSVERMVCAQTIQQYLQEMPEIVEQEEFEKLKREYDIQVEGEQVWVGK